MQEFYALSIGQMDPNLTGEYGGEKGEHIMSLNSMDPDHMPENYKGLFPFVRIKIKVMMFRIKILLIFHLHSLIIYHFLIHSFSS